jgi:DNA polymerase-3 subunit alpha
MPAPVFAHLRLHSEYSIVDGTVRIEDAVARAAQDGMPALALTDFGNLFGMVKFYGATRSKGIKPIIGCDVWIAANGAAERDRGSRLLLLAKNRSGYLRLCELLTDAYLGARNRGRAEVTRASLAKGDNRDLIALSGAAGGDIGQALQAGNGAAAEKAASEWAAIFPGSFYIEIQRAHANGQAHASAGAAEALVSASVALAARLGLPVVATHPVQFLDRDDFKAHEARVCIAEGYVLADTRRPKAFTEEQYFKTQAEMQALFADLPEALENSIEIARRCSLSIELGKNKLPLFPTPAGMTLDEFLAQEAAEGLEKRLARLFPAAAEREKKRPEYQARLEFEIKTIQQMGFPGYFLIVADFIRWAKGNGVPVGPGRGSGAGSLVAYALDITDLDPLRYDLLFERFLNPERVSMPDFDVDFCQEGRDRVIDYVKRNYGSHAVSQIVTFGTMAAKAVIRDVGRVLDLGYNFVDQFAKLIPNELGITLKDARGKEPQINERAEREEEIRELLILAEKLEGLTRNVGMHAGGVLIAPGRLTDFCPLYSAAGAESAVSQFDKDDVEKIGLVKFDFLGLRTLTILAEAVESVRRLNPDMKDFRLEDLPLDDPAVYKLFADGNTTAVFQSESRSAKDIERRLKGDCFEDLIALMALNRPGPLQSGMVDDFINRKNGRAKAEYFHPDLEPVLKPTYGVIVYQEQVMLVAQVLAGYTLGGADLLRRAMGKKKAEEMAQQRAIFLEGATKRGVNPKLAEQLFDLMEKFAEYGFNKSHSAAYALVAYQTAWLKAHYPSEFMAATLSSEMADTDKVQLFWNDCVQNNITFLPPDINRSQYRFTPVDMKTIRYGLGAIKGTGESAIGAILRAREAGGDFADLFDFCKRIDKRVVNRRVIEALVRAGALDSLDEHRARLLASVGVALEAAEQAERDALQAGLFDAGGGQAHRAQPIEAPRWSEREQLLNEKQALGFFLSGHPYNECRAELAAFVRRPLASLEPGKEAALLAGIALATRTQMTRRGKMIFILLDDGTAQQEVAVFNEVFEAERAKIKVDEVLVIEGKVQRDDFSGGLRVVADKLMTLGEARGRFAKALRLAMNGAASKGGTAATEKLRTLLAPYRNGPCPVRVRYRNGEAECELPLGEAWRVRLDDELLAGLQQWLRAENVQIVYQ